MRTTLAVTMLVFAMGCSKPATEGPTADATADVASESKRLTACELVSAAEMSTIIAVEMKATEDAENSTKCSYQPTSGRSMPMVELAVDVGGGEAAMVAGKIMSRMENGELNDPLRGVGDQAFIVGPEAMIRHGDDLVRIMVYGADDGIAAIKQIFETAAARLP